MADLPYADLEGYQTGHPWIVLNKGRVGFSASDARIYPPEARRPLALPWIAAHRDLAEYHAVSGLDAKRLYATELDEPIRDAFTARLRDKGLDPADYHWLPVHPWQWDEAVLTLFTGQVANQLIVPLGTGRDSYVAQQSIRTFSNITAPYRHHVKLPLSILNTLVWRGLPTERTLAAPAVTAWVQSIAAADPYLREQCRIVLLGEVASVTVHHPVLDALPAIPYQYRELLGAIWREPLPGKLEPHERARTLASLLYVDPRGRALVTELIARSGLEPQAWLDRLFAAMLPPLLHYLYAYGTAFSPHGENAIVIYDEHDTPARLAIKDFVDDVNISAKPLPELASLPPEVAGVLLREPPDYLCQFLHSGLFVGHFRYLATVAEQQLQVPGELFWQMVRDQILAYHAEFPSLADRFATFDLLTPRIDRLCLNRNRLLLDGYRDRPDRPHAAVHGTVPNPLHRIE
jgi:siderophore synthetase component